MVKTNGDNLATYVRVILEQNVPNYTDAEAVLKIGLCRIIARIKRPV